MRNGFLRLLQPQGIPWPFCLFYDRLAASGVFQRHYELVARDILACRARGRLLDVGTGPAQLLIRLHQECPTLALVGVDISKGMVAKARKNVARAGLAEAIDIQSGAAQSLPFEDESFDVVVSTGSMHHWPDPAAGLREVHRVLKPGGVGLMYDLVSQPPPEVLEAGRRQFGKFRMLLLWLHTFEEPFHTTAELDAAARATPFRSDGTHFVGVLCCLTLRKDAC